MNDHNHDIYLMNRHSSLSIMVVSYPIDVIWKNFSLISTLQLFRPAMLSIMWVHNFYFHLILEHNIVIIVDLNKHYNSLCHILVRSTSDLAYGARNQR